MKKIKKNKKIEKGKIFGLMAVLLLFGVIAYFFISPGASSTEVPSYVKGEMRLMYEWAKTPEGGKILEQIPCYCGCKYEGHLHARHCFWKDNGNFDKHGITCSVCFDIAKKSKGMSEQGKGICEIRKTIDDFYAPNKELGTETPLPEGCK
ncbi:hypothetical protein J4443_03115 [Candidatus Woesearchaeota archaeon]|nr:hypothetical protein [Candidatus Woesearchaeota archaeon]